MVGLSRLVRAALVVVAACLLGACIDIELGGFADIRAVFDGLPFPHVFRFRAATGDPVTLRITGKKGTTADFAVTLTGPAGVIDLSAAPGLVDAPGVWSLAGFPAPATGDYRIEVISTEAVEFKLHFEAGTAKTAKLKLDLRPKKLRVAGDVTFAGRRIGSAGGTVAIGSPATEVPESLAKLVVPAGALDADTYVFFVNAAAPALDDPAARRAVGPAIRVGPDRRGFLSDVTVEVPLDRRALPKSLDAIGQVRVLSLDADGRGEALVPDAVVTDGSRTTAVVVKTRRTGTFMAFVDRTASDLGGLIFAERQIDVEFVAGAAFDSSVRRVTARRTALQLDQGGACRELAIATRIEVTRAGDGAGAVARTETPLEDSTGTWSEDGGLLQTTVNGGGTVLRRVSDDAAALLRVGGDGDGVIRFAVALRPSVSSAGALAVAAFSGTYRVGGLEFRAAAGGSGPARLGVAQRTGTLTINVTKVDLANPSVTGTWSAVLGAAGATADGDGVTADRSRVKMSGTLAAPTGDDTLGTTFVLTRTDVAGAPPIHVTIAGTRNEALVALASPEDGDPEPGVLLLVGTKRGAKLALPAFAGEHAATALGISLTRYALPGDAAVQVPDVAASSAIHGLRIAAEGTATLHDSGLRRVSRDETVQIGFSVVSSAGLGDGPSLPCSVKSDGAMATTLDSSRRASGGITASGEFGYLVPASSGPEDLFSLFVFIRVAP